MLVQGSLKDQRSCREIFTTGLSQISPQKYITYNMFTEGLNIGGIGLYQEML